MSDQKPFDVFEEEADEPGRCSAGVQNGPESSGASGREALEENRVH
ncbi:MAG: hypothetical protein L0322_08865 [Chloroflexi bacterium]|nr:hypothetical protein [Chloroflexota bacterium]MCI0644883.1 hypothetical protein [Chloroflexota bacterium]